MSLSDENTRTLAAPPPLRLEHDALFLDLDGTLLDIAERPDAVSASEELRALLKTLAHNMRGAVALITGRTIADADAILDGALYELAGVHGFEMRSASARAPQASDAAALSAAREDVYALAEKLDLLVEDKTASYALHFRHAPHLEACVHDAATRIAAAHGLHTLPGRMVLEIVAGTRGKGDALSDFMAHAPYAGRRAIAIGDDITDDHAFEAARRLGGFGILVGERAGSAASYALPDPRRVHAWLAAALKQRGE